MPARTETEADYGVLRWLVLATFIVILNETLMFNAIPRLIVEFSITERAAQWLSTAFMLTMAVVIPITGWFLQRVTTRTAFKVAMATFSTGTLLAALAPTFGVLLAARVIQASGTAVMMPLLMTTLMMVVAEHDRGRVMGNVTLAISVAPALGPAVSGVILDLSSWRWMFGVVLPIAIAISVVSLRSLENVGETNESPIDWASVVLCAVGFGPLVYGLSQFGADDPTVSPTLTLVVGLVAVGVFVLRQLQLQKVDAPLLDLRTLLHPTYTLGLVLMSVAFMAMMGSFFLLPLYLQNVVDLSELETGLLLMPGGLAMGLLGPRVGTGLRQGRRPAAGDPRCLRHPGRPRAADPDRAGDVGLVRAGRAPAADGQPGRAVHTGVHAQPGCGAAAAVLARLLDPRHAAAGRGRDRHCSRRHGRYLALQPRWPRAVRARSTPRSAVCSGASQWARSSPWPWSRSRSSCRVGRPVASRGMVPRRSTRASWTPSPD